VESYAGSRRRVAVRARGRFGGTEGNELLTIGAAGVLTVLLVAEGVTLLQMGPLLSVHMFVGLVLIPPVLLKLASTGYRMVRYYTHARPYVAKGPPALPMRLLAPVLAVCTVGILATGVWLLALGHKSDQLVLAHKAFFFAWSAAFGIHFLVYLPMMLNSLRVSWRASQDERIPGSGVRGLLVAASLGAGFALALTLANAIAGWQSGPIG
jgi:hypothetical protein